MRVSGAGLVLTSSARDRRADQFVRDHVQNRWLKAGNSFGNALPWLVIAGAGVAVTNSISIVSSDGGPSGAHVQR